MHVYGGGAYPAYLIDAETLREELLSEEDTREWLEEVPDDPHAVSFWRMLGELDRALAAGRGRLAEQDEGSDSWAAAALRLAHVHHWREVMRRRTTCSTRPKRSSGRAAATAPTSAWWPSSGNTAPRRSSTRAVTPGPGTRRLRPSRCASGWGRTPR